MVGVSVIIVSVRACVVRCVIALSDALSVGASLLATQNVRCLEQARSHRTLRRIIARANQTGRFIGEREQRIALGAGKPLAALFAGKQPNENAGEQQTEEDCDWYNGHAWNVCAEYRPYRAIRLRIRCD